VHFPSVPDKMQFFYQVVYRLQDTDIFPTP
jgi:hypothetical protein